MAARKNVKSKRTPKRESFLAAYAKCGNLSMAAKLAKCNRSDHYRWLKSEEYAGKFAAAHEEAIDLLEAEARRRAFQGTRKPVFYKGVKCGVIQEYSDTLLIFLLKAARPEMYRERFDHQHAGRGGGPVQMVIVEELVSHESNNEENSTA